MGEGIGWPTQAGIFTGLNLVEIGDEMESHLHLESRTTFVKHKILG